MAMMKKKTPKKIEASLHALRHALFVATYDANHLRDALDVAWRFARDAGATDELALAVKALRSIANHRRVDERSRGIALGALARLKVSP